MSSEVGGAGGAYSYSALKRLDQVWSKICSAKTGGSIFCFSNDRYCDQCVEND